MTRRIRIHTEQPLALDATVRLEADPARHLLKVLRRRVGDPVVLFNGDGRELAGQIVEAGPSDHCRVQLHEESSPAVESPLRITLVQAIARGERMDWAIQKACELGVATIQPVFAERTEVRLDQQRTARRLAHWRGVAIAACEQSGRVRVPEISAPLPLTESRLTDAAGYFLDPDGKFGPAELPAPEPPALVVVIGPEGGLSEAETAWLGRNGYAGLRLGPRILRTETAGAAVLAMLQTRFGDWQ